MFTCSIVPQTPTLEKKQGWARRVVCQRLFMASQFLGYERGVFIETILPNDVLLSLYGFYKQDTVKECNISKLNTFNSQGRAKWNAWNSLRKMPQIEAKRKYIEKLYSGTDVSKDQI
uniref:ACB domain-containing protein n=1 Tax=Megaselia scalaris TaxID=36166 RepID=T1GQ32_MEGSC